MTIDFEPDAATATAAIDFEPDNATPAAVIDFEPDQAPDRSFGSALIYGIDQPLENLGTTAEVLGQPEFGAALKNIVKAPENYESAASRFVKPQEGDFTLLGFAPAQLPRAIVEQFGQAAGSLISRVAGGLAGGFIAGGAGAAATSPTGPGAIVGGGVAAAPGVVAGQFVGPFLFGALQTIGPVALERARRNGRTEPTGEDIAASLTTAAASGALDSIGAQYLPGGKAVMGPVMERIIKGFAGEFLTETGQSVIEQFGQSVATKHGLEIDPREAVGEGVIGGGTGAASVAVTAPLLKSEAPKTAAAVEATIPRTQPVTVTVPEVVPPPLPSGRLGPPDPLPKVFEKPPLPTFEKPPIPPEAMPVQPVTPVVEQAEVAGAPLVAQAAADTETPSPAPEPVTPAPAAVSADTAPPPAAKVAGEPLPEPTRTEPSPVATPAAAVPEVAAPAAKAGEAGAGQFRAIAHDARVEAAKTAEASLREGRGDFTARDGRRFLVTPSSEPDVMVRVTRLSENGNPIGHVDLMDQEMIDSYLKHSDLVDAVFHTIRPDLSEGWKHGTVLEKARQSHVFTYELRSRPASIGTHPEGGRIIGDRTVEYDRPLTKRELSDFELKPTGAKPTPAAPAAPAPAPAAPAPATAAGDKTRLDLILDGVERTGKELTVEVTDANRESLTKIIDTVEKRGLRASTDGRFVLIRPAAAPAAKAGEGGDESYAIPNRQSLPEAPKGAVENGPSTQAGETETPKRVRIAGADFDVVRKNEDGTLRLKSEGGEFDTMPGESWIPIGGGTVQSGASAAEPTKVSRAEYQKSEQERISAQRKIKLLEVENEIRRTWTPKKPLPVGINKVSAFETQPRHTPEQRRLLARLENARRDASADLRADIDHAGRVWDALNKQAKPTPAAPAAKAGEGMTRAEMDDALAVLLTAPSKAGGKPRVSFKTQIEETWFRRGFEAANDKPGQPPPEQQPGVPAKDQKLHDAFAQGWGQAQMKLRAKPTPAAPAAPAPAPVAGTAAPTKGRTAEREAFLNKMAASVKAASAKEGAMALPASTPSRVQLRSGPATYSVVEQLAPQKGDQPGEVYFRVKNERTGEEQTVEAADMKPVKAKGAAPKPAEAKAMKKKLRGSESGAIPASIFADIADFGARIYRDGMSFVRWSADMVRHLGERVRSALKELWVGMLNPKGARNLRGEVIQKRDEGGAIGAAGGRSKPQPGAPVEGGREGEYYTRVAERDKGTLSDEAFAAVRRMTTIPDEYQVDVDAAAALLDGHKTIESALRSVKAMRHGAASEMSGVTDRQRIAALFLITQKAAQEKNEAKNAVDRAFWLGIEIESLADLKGELTGAGKALNMAGQLYARMPKSADAMVLSDEALLHRMTGGEAAEVEAAQAKDTLKTALDEQLKGMDESIRDIMRTKPKASWDEIRQRIADEVVAKMNLATEAERKAATDKIIADLKKRMEKVRKELLAKMTRPSKKGSKTALDKLWKLFEMGALDDDTLTKVFMEKAGVQEFTPAFRDKLKKMYEDAEAAPEGMPRERILGNIAVELAMANPKTFGFWWNLAMSISYGNILGAFTTIFVNNPLGSAATAGEMTIMAALSNKGARRETLKGAVKTWARSFGDGVAMMRDLWSTGENLQKVSQFDSALVNSPVELLAKMAEDPAFPKKFKLAAKAVSQYKWVMRAMMAADAVIRWPAREALRFTQSAALAKETRRPGQSLEDAVDELNYPGGRQAAVREARAQAAQERRDGTLKTKLDERLRVIQLLQSKLSAEGTEAATESDELANYGSLLNDQPQDFIGVIASAILKVAFPSNTKSDLQKALGGAAQPFVRFVRTSANATRVMLDYAVGYGAFRYMTREWPVIGADSLAGGVNLIQPGGKHKMSEEAAIRAGDRLTQVRIQRAYLGMALYAGLAAIYAAIDDDEEDPYIDFIGSGPTTPDERRRVRESGVRLNSIKIGNTYIPTSVGPLQPLAGIIAPFQRMRDNKKWPKAKDEFDERVPEMAGVAAAKGIADAMMNQSFTRSLADLLTMMNTGKTSFGETPTEFIGKNVSQFIPGNLRGLSQLDEIARGKKERADGFFDTAANAIAFYAPNGRATTILGDEVDAGKSVAQKAGEKVFQFTTLADDKTLQFVVKNGMTVPDRQRKRDGRRQTYLEYSAYMRESGKMMRAWLESGGMEALQKLPAERKNSKGKTVYPRKEAMNDRWKVFRNRALVTQ